MPVGNMSDADGLAQYNVMIATISANLAAYAPLVAADMTAAGSLRDDFDTKFLTHNQSQAQATADTAAKNAARKAMDDDKRRIRAILKANGISEELFNALGYPSGGASGEAVSNATVPIGVVDTSQRLKHTIDFRDAAPGATKRRPRDTDGCEIWIKIDGAPPGSEKDCVFLTLDTRTPHTVDFDPADAGKMAHYLLRWQFKDGSKSAWGETVSATITG